MSRFTNQVAQVVRNTRSGTLPAGEYQYNDVPQSTLDMRVLEAQWLTNIVKQYGSIEAYNQREE